MYIHAREICKQMGDAPLIRVGRSCDGGSPLHLSPFVAAEHPPIETKR
jgi:hypothetical protein